MERGYGGQLLADCEGVRQCWRLQDIHGSCDYGWSGVNANDTAAFSVQWAGDVNGDGLDDLLVGAPLADPNGPSVGQAYIIFGRGTAMSATFELSTLLTANGGEKMKKTHLPYEQVQTELDVP